jgi:hypothetical protein
MTDTEKHAWCKERTGYPATILPPSLYNLGKKEGHDMRWYVKARPLPARAS